MKFTITKHDLVAATSSLAPALQAKPSMPILRGMLITVEGDRALFDATDQTTTITTSRPCEGTEDGRVLVAGRLLSSIVNSLPEKPVTLTVDGSNLTIVAGRSHFQLPTMTLDDYPVLPDAPEVVVEVSGHDLSTAVHAAGSAAGRDDTLPMLTGIKMEAYDGGLTLAATDRFRLAVRTIDWDGADFDLLAPARALLDAVKQVSAQPAQILTDGSRFGLRFGQTTIITRLIDADFPKFRPLLPKQNTSLASVEIAPLLDAIRRVSLVTEGNSQIRMAFEDSGLTISGGGSDIGVAEEQLPCAFVGEPLVIAFNPGYLKDGLGAIHTDRVVFGFTQPSRPAILLPEPTELPEAGPDGAFPTPETPFIYLLMPVRLPG